MTSSLLYTCAAAHRRSQQPSRCCLNACAQPLRVGGSCVARVLRRLGVRREADRRPLLLRRGGVHIRWGPRRGICFTPTCMLQANHKQCPPHDSGRCMHACTTPACMSLMPASCIAAWEERRRRTPPRTQSAPAARCSCSATPGAPPRIFGPRPHTAPCMTRPQTPAPRSQTAGSPASGAPAWSASLRIHSHT